MRNALEGWEILNRFNCAIKIMRYYLRSLFFGTCLGIYYA